MSLIDLARELEMSIPGVGYAVEKGETIIQDNKYQLIGEIYFIFLRMSPLTLIAHYCIISSEENKTSLRVTQFREKTLMGLEKAHTCHKI